MTRWPVAGAGNCNSSVKAFAPGPVHGRTHGEFDGLQIHVTCPFPILKDHVQKLCYFALDLPLNGFGSFFSWDDIVSGSTGRIRQSWALTSINSLCRLCSLRNSATSRSAFAIAAWPGSDSVTVLPSIL